MRYGVYFAAAFLALGVWACKSGGGDGELHQTVSLSGEVVFPGKFGDREIAQATVRIESDGKVIDQVLSDQTGGFIFYKLPTGEFDLIVEKGDQYALYRFSTRYQGRLLDTAQFPATGYSLRVEMKFRSTVLTGQVVDANTQAPIEQAAVSTYPSTMQVVTDELGNYRLESDQFEDGIKYAIQVRHHDYQLFFEPYYVQNFQLADENNVPLIKLKQHELDEKIEPDDIKYFYGEGNINLSPGPR